MNYWNEINAFFAKVENRLQKENSVYKKYQELKEKYDHLNNVLSGVEEESLEYEEQLNEFILIAYELSDYYEMDAHLHEREAQKYLYEYYRANYLKLQEY